MNNTDVCSTIHKTVDSIALGDHITGNEEMAEILSGYIARVPLSGFSGIHGLFPYSLLPANKVIGI